MRVRIAVPASVANLGPGFDILALALQLQNDIRAEQRPGALSIDAGPDAPMELNDPENNLVTAAYTKACAELGVPATGVHFACVNRIPIGRGMGSSAAAALTGILVATALHQAPWDEDAVLDRVAELEGHRDNAAAALLGGLAICAPGAPAAQMAVSDELRAVLFIPDVAFRTRRRASGGPEQLQQGRRDLQCEPVRAPGASAGDRRSQRAPHRHAGSLAPGRPVRPHARGREDRRRGHRRRCFRRGARGSGTLGHRPDATRTRVRS